MNNKNDNGQARKPVTHNVADDSKRVSKTSSDATGMTKCVCCHHEAKEGPHKHIPHITTITCTNGACALYGIQFRKGPFYTLLMVYANGFLTVDEVDEALLTRDGEL